MSLTKVPTNMLGSGVAEDVKRAFALTSVRSWGTRTIPNTNNYRQIAYGKGLFVAISSSGVGNRVLTSRDGITWTARTSAADSGWVAIVFANNKFTAIAAATAAPNGLMESLDGITWSTAGNNLPNLDWQGITFSNELGLYVAVAQADFVTTVNRVATSVDGVTWTLRTPASQIGWREVTWGNGLFVSVASTGAGNRAMSSPDGITWTLRATSDDATGTWNGVAFGSGRFVACSGNSLIMTSTNGTTWTTVTHPFAGTVFQHVTFANGVFIILCTNAIIYSPNGLEWFSASTLSGVFVGATFGSGMFIAVSGQTTGTLIGSSPVGIDFE